MLLNVALYKGTEARVYKVVFVRRVAQYCIKCGHDAVTVAGRCSCLVSQAEIRDIVPPLFSTRPPQLQLISKTMRR